MHSAIKYLFFLYFISLQWTTLSSPLYGQILQKKDYQKFKENGLWGLKDKEKKVVLAAQYQRLHLEEKNGLFAVEYALRNGKRGILAGKKGFPVLIEVDSSYKNLDYLGSEQYFAYCKRCLPNDGYHYRGVINQEEKVIFVDKYIGIEHDGGKLFFVGQAKRLRIPEFDFQYSLFDVDSNLIADRRYSRVIIKHGIILGKKRETPTDIWGHSTCIINQEGEEITDFIFKDGGIYLGIFDKTLKMLRLRKDGKHHIYYPTGEKIPCELPDCQISLLSLATPNLKKSAAFLNRKDLIGYTRQKDQLFFITYSGEAMLYKE